MNTNETPASVPAAGLSVPHGSARPGDAGVWSVGDPNNPTREDALCGSESAARENAKAISDRRVAAVWHGTECVALYFECRAYRPC
jgi:hypothetical protein